MVVPPSPARVIFVLSTTVLPFSVLVSYFTDRLFTSESVSVLVFTWLSRFSRFSPVVLDILTYAPSLDGRTSLYTVLPVTICFEPSSSLVTVPVPMAVAQASLFFVLSVSVAAVVPSAPYCRLAPILEALMLASFWATLTASVSFVPAATPLIWRVTLPSAVPMDTAALVAFQVAVPSVES